MAVLTELEKVIYRFKERYCNSNTGVLIWVAFHKLVIYPM